MNDRQLFEEIAALDPCPSNVDLPDGAKDAPATFTRVEQIMGERTVRSRWAGWLVAAAVFSAVVVIGLATAFVMSTTRRLPPITDETLPPATTSVPSVTVGITPLASGETLDLLASFVAAFDSYDAFEASGLVSPDFSVDFVPWVDSGLLSPSATNLGLRIAEGSLFEDRADLDTCNEVGTTIECRIERTDILSRHLDLEPWVEIWVFEVDDRLISSLTVGAPDDVRATSMKNFGDWVSTRVASNVLAGSAEWIRTDATLEVMRSNLVEYGALQSGVPETAWSLVDGFFSSLSSADIDAAMALFAPGGAYKTYEDEQSVQNAPWIELSGPVADPLIRQQFAFWYGMLHMDWQPLHCTGDAVEVRCRTSESGVSALARPGGSGEGLVVFGLSSDGIVNVDDFVARGNDLREFWQDWVADNASEYHDIWSTAGRVGNGSVPLTQDVADATLELYPAYLVSVGVEVPPEYLNGSLLSDEWVSPLSSP